MMAVEKIRFQFTFPGRRWLLLTAAGWGGLLGARAWREFWEAA